MSKAPSQPQQYNPYQISQAQQGANINTAIANARLNDVNQVTPYGSVNYSFSSPGGGTTQPAAQPTGGGGNTVARQPYGFAGAGMNRQTGGGGVPAPYGANQGPRMQQMTARAPAGGGGAATTGVGGSSGLYVGGGGGQGGGSARYVPAITQTTTLSPQQQAILDQQQNLKLQAGGAAGTTLGNLPTGPMSFSNAPAMPTEGQYNADAANAVYGQQTAYLDPQFATQQQQLTDQMRDQGIPEGSAAWNQQMDAFNRQKTFAYQQAKDASIQEGYNVANMQFGQGMEARQQGVSEAEQLYQMPFTAAGDLASIYAGGGGQGMPQSQAQPVTVGQPNITGAFDIGAQQAQNQYQNQANVNAQIGGDVSNLASTAAMYALFGGKGGTPIWS